MVDRRPIQQSHERAYVDHFLNWFNRAYRSNFQVVSEPNPPEAVIRSDRTTRWVEVGTAFWNKVYARDLFSYATSDEPHKSIGPGPFCEMDKCFAQNFVSLVKNKLEKKSYVPWRNKYGPGFLVVPIKHPWFDEQTVARMKAAWTSCSVSDLGCFRSVRIAFPSRNEIRFFKWPRK